MKIILQQKFPDLQYIQLPRSPLEEGKDHLTILSLLNCTALYDCDKQGMVLVICVHYNMSDN